MNRAGPVLAGCLLLAATSFPGLAAAAHVVLVNLPLSAAHPVAASGWRAFVEAAERDGLFAFQLFVDGSLLGRDHAMTGLAQGDAQMGYATFAAHPAGLRHRVTLGRLALAGPDPIAGAAAMTEFVMLHCPSCLDSLAKRGVVFLGSHAAGPFHLLSPSPLARADSLEGVRIASPGPPWDTLLRRLQGQPEAVAGSLAAALEGGRVDAVLGPVALIADAALARQVRAVTAMHLGVYRVSSPFSANLAFWRVLGPEERAALLDAAPFGLAAAALAYRAADEKARKAMAEAGTAFSRAHPALVKAAIGFDAGDGTVELRSEGEGANALAARFRGLHDKYISLFAGDDLSVESVAAILQREIFDRLDIETYGLGLVRP